MELTNKLTAIADAIREKTGTTEPMTLDSMATAISGITGGGGGGELSDYIPESALTISGDCNYMFYGGKWDWFIKKYGDRITTQNIEGSKYMFGFCNLDEITFKLNFKNTESLNISSLFYDCKIKKTPVLNIPNTTKIQMDAIFQSCSYLKDLNGAIENEEEFVNSFQSYIIKATYDSANLGGVLKNLYSLRSTPSWLYSLKINQNSTSYPYSSYVLYYRMNDSNYSLDEINNIPVWKCQGYMTSNMFSDSFSSCCRAKEITFETNEDGTPVGTEWKTQTIDLSKYLGYAQFDFFITRYNSGITADKQVTDDATYQALKDDPDWFTTDIAYSRYNHDSAVRTINSLPDTSAYLASAGGTNTIKFKGASGSATDGGAINTLTEEEIAVATAKGWTVTLV